MTSDEIPSSMNDSPYAVRVTVPSLAEQLMRGHREQSRTQLCSRNLQSVRIFCLEYEVIMSLKRTLDLV